MKAPSIRLGERGTKIRINNKTKPLKYYYFADNDDDADDLLGLIYPTAFCPYSTRPNEGVAYVELKYNNVVTVKLQVVS